MKLIPEWRDAWRFLSVQLAAAIALLAAALWAGYILVGKRVADAHGGLDALALGMSTAAAIFAPIIIGLTVLHQVPGVGEIAGIGLVVAGLLLGTRGGR